jgi:hypothetical protein
MKYIPLTLIALTISSCANTRHTVYDPTTGNRISTTVLGGDYGIAKQGDIRGGGRVYVDATRKTRIAITAKGDLTIDGPINHSTRAAIQADAAAKITGNAARLVGWLSMMDTIGNILEPQGASTSAGSLTANGEGNQKPPTGGVGNGGKPHPVDPNKGPGKGNLRKG